MKKYTCEQLGICQDRAECHVACSSPPQKPQYFFAPGAIDIARRNHFAGVRKMVPVLAYMAVVAAAVAMAAVAVNLLGLHA